MIIHYRSATEQDGDAIAALYARCFTDTFVHLYDPRDLDAFLATRTGAAYRAELADPRFHFRLADVDGSLAGFVKLGPAELPIETPPRTIELRQLYVLTPWQGKGVAAALMLWSVEEARAAGAEHLQLNVYVDNHRAQRFYGRHGFQAVGRYQFMVGEHADEEIIMRAAL